MLLRYFSVVKNNFQMKTLIFAPKYAYSLGPPQKVVLTSIKEQKYEKLFLFHVNRSFTVYK